MTTSSVSMLYSAVTSLLVSLTQDGCAAGPVYCTATGVLGSTADTWATNR